MEAFKIEQQTPLLRLVLGLADDAMVFSHRLSQWCSHAPYLEEDIALANVALDYLGRARLFYQYAGEISGQEYSEDDFAYLRHERQFTNHLIYELPKGDFAFTMLRQYFLDEYACLYLPLLIESKDERLAAIASKAIKESRYHLQRSQSWLQQLALGTEESRRRLLAALDELKDFIAELFDMPAWEQALLVKGIAVERTKLQQTWQDQVKSAFSAANLPIITLQSHINGGRSGVHTEHLGHLLCELQYLPRRYPDMQW